VDPHCAFSFRAFWDFARPSWSGAKTAQDQVGDTLGEQPIEQAAGDEERIEEPT
jgi:hypothetical protein